MFRSSNQAVPPEVAPLLALATDSLRAGQPAEAIAPLREAALLATFRSQSSSTISASPASRSAAFRRLSRHLQRAVASQPAVTPMHISAWGSLWRSRVTSAGQFLAYDRATELRPSLTEAWFRAGALVYTLGHRDEAIGCFRRAAATGGETSFGRLGKARALLTEERNQEAEQVLRTDADARSEERLGARPAGQSAL